jgi:hypothetical protein
VAAAGVGKRSVVAASAGGQRVAFGDVVAPCVVVAGVVGGGGVTCGVFAANGASWRSVVVTYSSGHGDAVGGVAFGVVVAADSRSRPTIALYASGQRVIHLVVLRVVMLLYVVLFLLVLRNGTMLLLHYFCR